MGQLGNFGTSLTLLLAHLSLFRAHREHKVHNIVLYPDKESWCKTTPIKQVVTWPQCSSQELDNNVCVGACFSYMVPHSEPSAPGDLIRPYCDSCQPLDSIWHTVTLNCRDKDDKPTSMQKKVQIITNCSCSSCMESSRIKPDLNSLLQSLEFESGHVDSQPHQSHLQLHEQYQQIQHQRSQQQFDQGETMKESVSPEQTEHVSEVPGVAHDPPDLLLNPNLNGSNKSSGSGKANERFLQLFKQLSEPGLGVDKLDKLTKLEGLEKLEKLEKLATEYAGAKELLAKLNELLHKYTQDEKTGIEQLHDEESKGSASDGHLQVQPSSLSLSSSTSSSELSAPVQPAESVPDISELPKDDDDEDVPSLQEQQLRVAASLLHRTGPHHSMVLDAGVKEKIDVESHYLHPALAGQEISYHDNILLDKTKKKVF